MAAAEREPAFRALRLGPAVTDYVAFEAQPSRSLARCYFPTHNADRALAILSHRYQGHAQRCFWLGEPAGAGKSHFLNYMLSLERQLANAEPREGREFIIALAYGEPALVVSVFNDAAAALARELNGERRSAQLWRGLSGPAALEVALSEASRAGVRRLTLIVDLASNEPTGLPQLLELVNRAKRPAVALIVAADGRAAPEGAQELAVGAVSPEEVAQAAIARARYLESPRAELEAAHYNGLELEPFRAEQVFPFHPSAVWALARLAQPGSIAGAARLAREALRFNDLGRLIFECDLTRAPILKQTLEARLGTAGVNALRIAGFAATALGKSARNLARQVVRTLALERACGEEPGLDSERLWQRLPVGPGAPPDEFTRMLERLAERSRGLIRLGEFGWSFVPLAPSPKVEAFNQALGLARLFEPSLEPASEVPELNAKLARLTDAMASAAEDAQTLERVFDEIGLLKPERARMIADFIELAEAGPAGLIEKAADAMRGAAASAVVGAFRELAAAGDWLPRWRAMRDYLERIWLPSDATAAGNPLARLAVEERLLEAELSPEAIFSNRRLALEAGFEKFRWGYIEKYLSAHEQWRALMEQAAAALAAIRRDLGALRRLDSIVALGPALAPKLALEAERVGGSPVVCKLKEQYSATAAPRCPECGYVLGTPDPAPRLAALAAAVREALQSKLVSLSRGAIAQLLRTYDRRGRLEGFLKMVQAAQTEALARVLDDDLAAYINRLLGESAAVPKAALTSPKAALNR